MQGRTLESFLEENHLSQNEWEASKADWDVLQAIAKHHDDRNHSLCTAAGAIADRLRTFDGVHSVRWRVKDTDHLLEKIIRKKLQPEQNPRYVDISVENYTEVITDLIGVRALHLFKDDCIAIDQAIRQTWECKQVVIYTRKGDQEPTSLIEAGGEAKTHPKGYRSIHYIVETKPERFLVYGEVQVRTLFEEGWSEIDHKVRYPNFSDNPTVELFLGIFNGLAGSADEMGSFVKYLSQVIDTTDAVRDQAIMERDQALEQVSQVLEQLEEVKNDHAQSQRLIQKLKIQVSSLKSLEHATVTKTPSTTIGSELDTAIEQARKLGLEGLKGLQSEEFRNYLKHVSHFSKNTYRHFYGDEALKTLIDSNNDTEK